MEDMNRSLFMLMNAGAPPGALDSWLANFFAQWLIYAIPGLVVVLWLWGNRRVRGAAMLSSAALLLSVTANLLIASLWFHPRPFMVPMGNQYLAHLPESSFPSDHAVVFFSVGLGLLLGGLTRSGFTIVILGGIVGAARIYLGVHFPLDIIGALLVAMACNWLVIVVFRGRMGQRCLDTLELIYRRLFAHLIGRGWVQP